MQVLAALGSPFPTFFSRWPFHKWEIVNGNPRFRVFCSPLRSQSIEKEKRRYKPGYVDDLLLNFFRNKMVEEVGWDSEKPGYDGLIEVVNRLMMKGRNNLETEQAAVQILKSLFPPLLLVLFKVLVAPLGGGKLASMMVARATALSCQWLMGPCSVNSVDLPDGSSCATGVFVERCRYLEDSKCVGICVNTCKLPTQTFFKEHMGVPLYMEPKFRDYSCQFTFAVLPPSHSNDKAIHEPCLEICPNAARRKQHGNIKNGFQCPKACRTMHEDIDMDVGKEGGR